MRLLVQRIANCTKVVQSRTEVTNAKSVSTNFRTFTDDTGLTQIFAQHACRPMTPGAHHELGDSRREMRVELEGLTLLDRPTRRVRCEVVFL